MTLTAVRPAQSAGYYLDRVARTLEAAPLPLSGEIHAGVDLGTSTVVLTVTDGDGLPAFVATEPCEALRDGVVVDFGGAVEAVTRLVETAAAGTGHRIGAAAVGYPPGIGPSESRACRFVLERAGLDCTALVDEVSAANAVLCIGDGVLVDVGAGSTGVGIFRGGELVGVADVAGGGHHLNLILAGALGTSVEEAERRKRTDGADHLPILRPGLERIAVSIDRLSTGHGSLPVHLAGGGLMLPGAAEVVSQYLAREVVEYPHALYITPLGLAWSSQ
ncbi:MAG: ethanolamine utilization protein EutJ [bacterium]|nr:ethanolamine utilization protein EutJ [bacterium]